MINQQLLNYIKQQLATGLDKQAVKDALVNAGWGEQDITEAFDFYFTSNNPVQQSSTQPSFAPNRPEQTTIGPKNSVRFSVLLVILGIATVSYFVSAKYFNIWPFENSSPVLTLTPTPSQTNQLEGWKTYTDTKYGFEFKYPDSVKTGIPVDYTNGQQPDEVYFQTLEYSGKEAQYGTPEYKKGMYAEILILQNPKNLSLLDFARTQIYGVHTETSTTINGQTAVVFSYNSSNITEGESPWSFRTYFFQSGSKIFEIDGMTNYKPAADEHIRLFDQIIHTFKFTAPTAPQVTGPTDCGGYINCLVQAAQNSCQLSKVTHTMSMPHPFIALSYPNLSKITTKTYYEIKGKKASNCIIYEKFLSGSMAYDQTKLNQIVGSNPSYAQQAQSILDSTNQAYAKMAGKDATCEVTAQEFKDKIDKLLRGESSGSVSVNLGGGATNLDPYAQKCVGELYHPTTQ